MAWGPLHGKCQEFHGICIQDRMVTPKINAWTSTSISHPPCCELVISRMNRGGVKKSWSVMSFKPHQCDKYLHHQNTEVEFHAPLIPLHQTFHAWSSKEAPENIYMNAQSFLSTNLRGVSPVWCWASDRQFTICGASSVLLSSGVCFSRVEVVHLAHIAHMTIQRGFLSVGVMRKSQLQ